MNEFEFIDLIKQDIPPHPKVPLGPGDDTALIDFSPSGKALVTVDMLMDGTHFNLSATAPERIGHKALAVNLSDIAAMGGKATSIVVAVALPKTAASTLGLHLQAGIVALAQRFDIAIAGGDTNSWHGPLVISITAMGEPHAKGIVTRRGAMPGDLIFVTGTLGGSLDGHHLDFIPRLDEAKLLIDHLNINAMVDISDGLISDLSHICIASECGALLKQDAIPINERLQSSCSATTALTKALSDGEDFELCFTMSEGEAQKLLLASPLAIPVTCIGRCTNKAGIFWEDEAGSITPIGLKGYEHKF